MSRRHSSGQWRSYSPFTGVKIRPPRYWDDEQEEEAVKTKPRATWSSRYACFQHFTMTAPRDGTFVKVPSSWTLRRDAGPCCTSPIPNFRDSGRAVMRWRKSTTEKKETGQEFAAQEEREKERRRQEELNRRRQLYSQRGWTHPPSSRLAGGLRINLLTHPHARNTHTHTH
eukprot:Sspe_Gene.48516::Locus_25340_Transcript_4_6_Confidence_0.762_Length_582::g.48516::m.48516